MDFGLREWLLILGPLFIVIVLVHGYLRMRANKNTLKMALDKNFVSSPGTHVSDDEEISMLRAELPNGGARIKKPPEQRALDLDENVPVLMEPVEMGRGEQDAGDAAETPDATETPEAAEAPRDEPAREARQGERPEHFVVLYVTATGEPFPGQALLESLVELDMQFGEMDIFHRMDASGRPLFGLVNAVAPGTFDIAAMGELRTPAVSLFMRTHELDEPVKVFDEMVAVAQAIANELGGEVKDDSKSVLTPQTIEHSREEISAYQHRYC